MAASAQPVSVPPNHTVPPATGSNGMPRNLVDSNASSTSETQSTAARRKMSRSGASYLSTASVPPPGSILTGKQEHYLKRELISQESKCEISELGSPTALQRFGAPFRSDAGEVAPQDSEFPILRYIFVHHVRNFPFLDRAREKEFWQDKLQVFLESFANKHISSSEDRLEDTKRKKLATKAQKLVELMMVSGLPTASGYEERIRFSEMEIVDRGANENGLVVNVPAGHEINGWDVNVAGVRTTTIRRHLRYHQHAEFLIRTKQDSRPDIYVGRRYGEFVKLHKRLRVELPGKVLPPLPRKNRKHGMLSIQDEDDAESISSVSTEGNPAHDSLETSNGSSGGLRSYLPGFAGGHNRKGSAVSHRSHSRSPRASLDISRQGHAMLFREEQRVSLRAFLRTLLQNEQIAQSRAMSEFLTGSPITLNEEELRDIELRKEMDGKRIEEQRQFYEIARKRARELDVHMEKFRRDIVERNGLSRLFQEIKTKNKISELSPEYQKFAEWLRIEVAATVYHVFLAEDNSPELFAQARRIHSLIPYGTLKNIIRIANPMAVMSRVLDLFLAQPFGTRSLMQRIFGVALNDSIRQVQRSIDSLVVKIDDQTLCDKVKAYTEADEGVKRAIHEQAASNGDDLLVTLLQSEYFEPELTPLQRQKVFNGYVAWENAVSNIDQEMRQGAELYAYLKQLLKLYMRQYDKVMMMEMIEEPTTLQLFRDLFTIFYEPLVRVYKSANVYNSITDFAVFVDDTIEVIEAAQRQDVSADPNQTVQAFIDLCARHEDNFYKFVHEVHTHDNGLFDQLMSWLEGILEFLRKGPRGGGRLDMNALFQGGADGGAIDREKAIREINSLIKWQTARKKWHQDKTRQKMAAQGNDETMVNAFKSSDFGLDEVDLAELELDDDGSDGSNESDDDDDVDPITAERRRRAKRQDHLRRSAGEPQKPPITELIKLSPSFVSMLRNVLAE